MQIRCHFSMPRIYVVLLREIRLAIIEFHRFSSNAVKQRPIFAGHSTWLVFPHASFFVINHPYSLTRQVHRP